MSQDHHHGGSAAFRHSSSSGGGGSGAVAADANEDQEGGKTSYPVTAEKHDSSNSITRSGGGISSRQDVAGSQGTMSLGISERRRMKLAAELRRSGMHALHNQRHHARIPQSSSSFLSASSLCSQLLHLFFSVFGFGKMTQHRVLYPASSSSSSSLSRARPSTIFLWGAFTMAAAIMTVSMAINVLPSLHPSSSSSDPHRVTWTFPWSTGEPSDQVGGQQKEEEVQGLSHRFLVEDADADSDLLEADVAEADVTDAYVARRRRRGRVSVVPSVSLKSLEELLVQAVKAEGASSSVLDAGSSSSSISSTSSSTNGSGSTSSRSSRSSTSSSSRISSGGSSNRSSSNSSKSEHEITNSDSTLISSDGTLYHQKPMGVDSTTATSSKTTGQGTQRTGGLTTTAAAWADGEGEGVASGTCVGRWLPSQDYVEEAATSLLHARLEERRAVAVAAAAAATALDASSAVDMLKDMLAATRAESDAADASGELGSGSDSKHMGGGGGGGGAGGGEGGGKVDGSAKPALVCRQGTSFRSAVARRRVVVVLHEASLTGAPLAVAELAQEAVRCRAAAVQAVLLNRKGSRELVAALGRGGVDVVRGKQESSWRVAASADVVVASSATAAAWIGSYVKHNPRGWRRILWWMMENRRPFFEQASRQLPHVGALVFIAQSQADMWEKWSQEEGVALPGCHPIVHLSVSPTIARFAGLPGLGGLGRAEGEDGDDGRGRELVGGGEAQTKADLREAMRERVRSVMGVRGDDVVVLCLSSVNPGKGQLGLVKAYLMAVQSALGREGGAGLPQTGGDTSRAVGQRMGGGLNVVVREGVSSGHAEVFGVRDGGLRSGALAPMTSASSDAGRAGSSRAGSRQASGLTAMGKRRLLQQEEVGEEEVEDEEEEGRGGSEEREKEMEGGNVEGGEGGESKPTHDVRVMGLGLQARAAGAAKSGGRLVLVIGSMGCKSNKPDYVRLLHSIIVDAARAHEGVARHVAGGGILWVNSTLNVAPLYAAADVYVMNAQGLGETFGRVTVEAMAFGLPVLATSAGGTREIVRPNVTGLLHPVGNAGVPVLSSHLALLASHPLLRRQMGEAGRQRVARKFMAPKMFAAMARAMAYVADGADTVEGGGVDGEEQRRIVCRGRALVGKVRRKQKRSTGKKRRKQRQQ